MLGAQVIMSQQTSPMPYVSPEGYHRHKCNNCGHIWEHSDCMAGDDDAHKCTKCGEEQWEKYKGNSIPCTICRIDPYVANRIMNRKLLEWLFS